MRHQKNYSVKKYTQYYLLVIATFIYTSAQVSAADVGLSLRIGQPGFYGEIHLGDFYPVPDLIYPDPVIIYTPPNVVPQPLYLHVHPKHVKNWRRYCIQYRACDRPVYFIREQWYNDVYVPHYNQHQHYDQPRIRQHDSHTYRRYDAPGHYDGDHGRQDNRHHNDKNFRHQFDKHDRHEPHDRGRGRKHDD